MEYRDTILCEHCQQLISWPIWARIEIGHYQALCWKCFDQLSRTFTASAAIYEATSRVKIWQGLAIARQNGGVR